MDQGHEELSKGLGLKVFAFVAARPRLFRVAAKCAGLGARITPTFIQKIFIPGWAKFRVVPTLAPKSFREQMKERDHER